ELQDVPFVNFAVTQQYARDHPDVVRGYVRAVRNAITWATAHPEAAEPIVRRYFPEIPAQDLGQAWRELLPAASARGAFSERGIQAYLNIVVTTGLLPTMPPTAEGVLWTNE